ncbi:MAG TPA: GNAT family N-acetyltransferase [Polyangiaceae bacterium]|nr:GNAT family N-acetyltransferase [Polyangiaceae bacterium]
MTREDLVLREATQGDYSAFVRLFPELAVTDPTPSRQAWQTNYVPSTTVACLGAVVVGYCYFQEYEDTGYIRHVVVAPDARRRGVGQSLMQAVGERLRAAGKKTWRLLAPHSSSRSCTWQVSSKELGNAWAKFELAVALGRRRLGSRAHSLSAGSLAATALYV